MTTPEIDPETWRAVMDGWREAQRQAQVFYEQTIRPAIQEFERVLGALGRPAACDCRPVCGEVSGPLRDRICRRGHPIP